MHQIESLLIERHGKAPNNFSNTLPSPKSDLAKAILKDPVNLSFLEMTEFAHERHLEKALIENIKKFLLELGAGFAFLGEQVRIEVGDQDFYTDLLFYHTKLHCYIVMDLKMGEFTPEHQGKMQFYVNVVDARMRDPKVDNPTIGIILCKSKNHEIVEFALKGNSVPVGVASYTLSNDDKKALALDALKKHLIETDSNSEKAT